MNNIFSPYVLIMIAAVMVCAGIIVYAWPHRRHNSETIPLILLLFGISEWIVAALLGLLDQNLSHKMLWAKVEYFGVVSVPLAVLGYVLHHFGIIRQLSIKWLAWLGLIPIITLLLAWTNGNHGLIWATYIPYQENGLVLSEKIYGAGFWIYWIYSYLVLLVATILTIRKTLVTTRVFRWQSIAVFIGIMAPWIGNFIYVMHIDPLKNFDLTPLAFSITGIMLTIGMFRWQLFDLKPVAHAAVIAGMEDGLIIIDSQGRVVEVNSAAKAILGLKEEEIFGKPMEQMIVDRFSIGEWPDLMNVGSIEIRLVRDSKERVYELSDSPFFEKQDSLGGRIIFLHDVTEKKHLEESLKHAERKHAELLLSQAENKYETLYQNMPVGVIYQGVDGKVLEFNPAAERILGVGLSQISDLASLHEKFKTIHGDGSDFPSEEHPATISLRTGKPLRDQLMGIYFSNEKNYRWININTVPQYKPGEEKPYQVFVTFEDVTERKKAEDALGESYQLLQTIIDTTPLRIFWKDKEMRYLGCNPAFAADADTTNPGDLIGKNDYQLVWKEQAELYRADDQQVMNSGIPKISFDEPQVTPEGEIMWIRTSKVPLRNKENQIIGILGVYDDITLYKKAEEALRTSESQLSNAMKIAQLGHWEYDFDKDRFTFNDHIYGLLRVTPEQVGGYSMSSSEYAQRFVHPDDAGLVAQEIKQAVETTDPHYNRQIEHRILYGDGEIGYIVVNFFIIKNHEGRTVKTYGVNQDITERKRAEIALKASEENYRSLIENSVSAIAVLGRDGRIIYANPRSIQIWNDPQIIGKTIFDIYPREYALRYSFAIKKVITTRIGIVDDIETLIGGRMMWFQISMSPLVNSDGSVNSVVLNAWDITERKQVEEELHFRNILLSTQQEASIDGVLVIDENARILSHNNRFVEMWHIPDHLIADGNAERLQQFVIGQVENASIFLRQIQNFYEHNEKIGTDEIILSDGRIFNYYSAPMIDMDNKYLGRVWFFHDDTEQKRVEAEIRQRNEDLLLMNVLNEAANRDNDVNEIVNIFIREITKVFACNNATLYLMSPDKRYIEMANTALSKNLTSVIEKLIGQPIPRIRISLKQASYFKSVLANQHGTIMSDPKLIQQWIGEFAETSFLPVLIRDAIKKLVPNIYKNLNIQSILTIPLFSSGQTIGLLDMSGENIFTGEDLRRVRTISHQLTTVILRKQSEENVKLHLQRISALNEIDRAISSNLDMRISLDVLLGTMLTFLKVDAAAVLLFNASTNTLEYFAGKGFRTRAIYQSKLRLGIGLAGQVGLNRRIYHTPDLLAEGSQYRRADLLKNGGFVDYSGVPIVAKGVLKGVLEVFNRNSLNQDQEWLDYLDALSGHAAIAIDNAQMFEGVQRSNRELILAYDATIAGWSHAMDLRDKETEGHSQRVTELTQKLAMEIGINQSEMANIRRGAMLHDIGKLGVPDRILLKPESLSEEEWHLMRQHPQFSFEMLAPISYLKAALDIPYSHHEKWDGTGYPQGLKGEEIPLAARLFAVVDVWDALCSDRPYRKAWPKDKVLAHIKAGSGTHFDPKVVELFLRIMN